jgi:hypothetical protein
MAPLLYGKVQGRATPVVAGGVAPPGHGLYWMLATALPQFGDFRDVAVVFFYVSIDILRCCKMFLRCFNNEFLMFHL